MPVSPTDQQLARLLSPAFGRESFRVDRRKPLTFVCGGNNSNGVSSLRLQFLSHIRKDACPILPVLAEKAFPHQLVERNLQSFEEFLASAANCVLIFVESPGSYAETGLFAALPSIIEKTFVVNTRGDHSRETSFLTLGPIKLIRKKSWFDEVLYLERDAVTFAEAQQIVEIILRTLPRYENALVFHPERKFSDLDLRLQLACVQMTVALLRAATAQRVTSILREHFADVDAERIERFLSLLKSIDAIERSDEVYFNARVDAFVNDPLICSTNFSVDEVRAQTLSWHADNDAQVAVFLREQLRIDI